MPCDPLASLGQTTSEFPGSTTWRRIALLPCGGVAKRLLKPKNHLLGMFPSYPHLSHLSLRSSGLARSDHERVSREHHVEADRVAPLRRYRVASFKTKNPFAWHSGHHSCMTFHRCKFACTTVVANSRTSGHFK
jgi:hypothetical protein